MASIFYVWMYAFPCSTHNTLLVVERSVCSSHVCRFDVDAQQTQCIMLCQQSTVQPHRHHSWSCKSSGLSIALTSVLVCFSTRIFHTVSIVSQSRCSFILQQAGYIATLARKIRRGQERRTEAQLSNLISNTTARLHNVSAGEEALRRKGPKHTYLDYPAVQSFFMPLRSNINGVCTKKARATPKAYSIRFRHRSSSCNAQSMTW
mmetsp:Transcript_35486/g.57031  ORF Transcript_35486/g.57031 Transcript_35486/m.57031 type:complete len:205 (-) Transcript_35486:164-778(-)